MDERKIKQTLRAENLRLDHQDERAAFKALERVFALTLPCKTSCEHLAVKRARRWIEQFIDREKIFEHNENLHRELIPRFASLAIEASSPGTKVPHAMFVHFLKKDFGYDGKGGFAQ